jgi:beta-glucanase (GH16 family)
MKHYLKKTAFIFLIASSGLINSCSSSDDKNDNGSGSTVPTNLQVAVTIAGQDADHPNGDGSGNVSFTATANNATGYSFIFPSIAGQYSATGTLQHQFTSLGTNTYSVTVQAYGAGTTVAGASTTVSVTVNYQPTLVWSDEFNTDGAPDSSKWGFDTGGGGWGNNEPETYTTDPSNVSVTGGNLKITVKKDPVTGEYTSARMNTAGKFAFTYGKIVVRAKLPIGAGTWPAIWLLGSNVSTAPWPACGEIDIMEHIGNNQNHILSTMHYPGHSGANGVGGGTDVPTVSTDFHEYAAVWSPSSIQFFVDDTLYFTFANNSDIPFNHDFFIILNVAIGGNFGGNIDPAFTESSMYVDYVRVYQ